MKSIVIHLLLLAASFRGLAQAASEEGVFIIGGPAFASASFRDAYANHMGGLGITGNFGGLLNPLAIGLHRKSSPVLLGIDLGWNYLGRSKYEPDGKPYLKTEFWTGNYGLLVRIDPVKRSRFKPFADAFAGWGRYWANTKLDKTFGQSLIDDRQYLVGKYNDNNFTQGLGLGFILKAKTGGEPSFTLRAMYYFNGEYRAVQRNSISVSGNYLYYQVGNVNANMLVIQAGVTIFE